MATSNFKPQPNTLPLPAGTGYPATGTKTKGVVTRGNGAATKGKTARGPMA